MTYRDVGFPVRSPHLLNRRQLMAGTLAALVIQACRAPDPPQSLGQALDPATPEPDPQSDPTAAPTNVAAEEPEPTTEPTPEPEPTATATPVPGAPLDADPFTLGVASGDPDDTSVVLWTRLAFDPQDDESMPERPVPVVWEVASDDTFADDDIVATGTVDAVPALAHSVHVTPTLPAGRWFWYRFHAGGFTSPIGRTRTMPGAGDDTGNGAPLRYAFSSCQSFQVGRYAAHRALAEAGDDIDLMMWLGDYIYEYGPGPTDASLTDRVHGSPEVENLAAYRNRYGQYKSDPDLQAHHAARPWIMTWDDHEVDNNYCGDISENDDDPDAFRGRRAAAYQAWYEHLPVRLDPPDGADYRIHRSLSWGGLARFHVLDGRQYRADQPSDGEFIPVPGVANSDTGDVRALGPQALDASRSLLGTEQEDWLVDGLSSATERWHVLVQPVMMHGLNINLGQEPPVTATDTWDGYAGNRSALLSRVADSGVDNLIVLSGDMHLATAADLTLDPFSADSPIVGAEFMASSISSRFVVDVPPPLATVVMGINPHTHFFDSRRGYVVCTVTPDELTAEYFAVEDSLDRESNITSLTTLTVNDGVPGIVRA